MLFRSRLHFYLKIEICSCLLGVRCLVHSVTALPALLALRVFFLQFPFLLKLTVLTIPTSAFRPPSSLSAPLRFIDYSNVLKNFYRSLSQWTYNRNPAGFKFFNYLPRSRSGCKDGNKYVYMSSVIFTFFQCIFLVPNFQKTTPFFKGDTNVRRIRRPAKRNVKLIPTKP